MGKIKEHLKKFTESLLTTLMNYPAEIFICIFAAIYSILLFEDIADEENILAIFPLGFALSYLLGNTLKNKRIRVLYYLSPLLIIPFFWIDLHDWVESIRFAIALGIALASVFIVTFERNNKRFASKVFDTSQSAVLALAFTGIAYGLLSLIYLSASYIFDLPNNYEKIFFFYLAMILMVIGAPTLFLTFIHGIKSIKDDIVDSRIYDVLINYLLTPALIIYTAVLYVYFAKITITWSLPQGGIAIMVFIFTMTALVVKMLRELQPKTIANWFYDNFSLISIPALIMFWAGVGRRVSEHGYTEARVYLVVCGFIMTIAMAMFVCKKHGRYLWVVLIAIFGVSVVTYIPGITAKEIGKNYIPTTEYPANEQEQRAYVNPNIAKIDISGCSECFKPNSYESDDMYYIVRDGMLVIERGEKQKEQLFSIELDEMLTTMLCRANVDKETVSLDYIEKNNDIFKYYENEDYRLIFSYMNLVKTKNNISIYYLDLSYVLIKDKERL